MLTRVSRNGWLALAVLATVCAAGGLLWRKRTAENAAGEALLARIESDGVFETLQRAPRPVRAAFLRAGFATSERVRQLRKHEQALVVALSQLRMEEAEALSRAVLEPVLHHSPSPEAAAAARGFRIRWSLEEPPERLPEPDPVPERTGDIAAEELVKHMLASRDVYRVASLAGELQAISSSISQDTAQRLADALSERILSEWDIALRTRLVLGFHAVGKAWPPARANQFAARALEKMRRTEGVVGQRTMALALSATQADSAYFRAAGDAIVARMTEASALGLRALGDEASPAAFDRAARFLIGEMEDEDLGELVEAFEILKPHLHQDRIAEAAGVLLERALADPRDAGWLVGFPVSEDALRRMAPLFRTRLAPCDIVLGLPEESRRTAVIEQLHNPYCSENSWRVLAAELLGTRETGDDEDLSPAALAGVEDDDGRKEDEVEVDFRALSRALGR